MNNYKTIEEYTQEMTKDEFLNFVEQEDLWPKNFGLDDDETEDAWDVALTPYVFKAAVPTLPKEVLPVLNKLAEIEAKYKKMDQERDKLKADLLKAMEDSGVDKWENDKMSITYIAPATRSKVDPKKLLKEYPDIYSAVIKNSKVKSSIRFKLKED